MSLPKRFNRLFKKMACILLSAFGSTYLCEQIFSHMQHILSRVKLKVTIYNPDIEILSKAGTIFLICIGNLCFSFFK